MLIRDAEEEASVRLLVFGAALVSIASRIDTRVCTELSFATSDAAKFEARAIADAVVEEARRLSSAKETYAGN